MPRSDARGPDGVRAGAWSATLAGVAAGALAVGVSELVAGVLPGERSVLASVADAIIVATPGPIVAFAIDTFGTANRAVLVAAITVVLATAAGVLGRSSNRTRGVAPVGFAVFAVVGAAAAVADPLIPLATAVLAPVVGASVATGALWWLLSLAAGPRAPTDSVVGDPSRRAFLGWAGATAGAAVVSGFVGRQLQEVAASAAAREARTLPAPPDPLPPPPGGASFDIDGLSPLLTPNGEFYRIDTAFTVPRVEPDGHVVRIHGLVDEPYELSYQELLEIADQEADVTLSCVSNEVGGDLVGTARWLGVPLGDVLDRAGVRPEATQVVGRAVDGWTSGFPIEAVYDGRTALVAVGMNGELLPRRHGFPARLVISGLYGYVSDTKWLSDIELTTFEAYDAYWVPRGWSRYGPIKTQSRIDVPADGATVPSGETVVAGVAWADERGVVDVEVAIDDGPWHSAELADELASTTWRQWRLRWDAPPGTHELRVRATGADGQPQTAERTPPAPDGATGHHTIQVVVGNA